MIERSELAALSKSVGRMVREYVGTAVGALSERMLALEQSIRQIPAGPAGNDGRDGIDGVAGLNGSHGNDGADGAAGLAGKDGIDGKDGAAGLSIKGDSGERGLPGPQGERGETGAVGPVGPKGESIKGDPGKDGASIHPDTLALMVLNEVTKAVAAIPKAKDGADGTPGRDALQLDILPAIPSKSVPRGTFAAHLGGIVRSNCATTSGLPMISKEWDVIVHGWAAPQITQGEDPREVSVACKGTDGTETVLKIRIPVPLHRGIYQDGAEYHQGDCVQFGGSMWMVRTASTKTKPIEGHADWVLVVKTGRPGKDGVNGKDGAEGKPGKDGANGKVYS